MFYGARKRRRGKAINTLSENNVVVLTWIREREKLIGILVSRPDYLTLMSGWSYISPLRTQLAVFVLRTWRGWIKKRERMRRDAQWDQQIFPISLSLSLFPSLSLIAFFRHVPRRVRDQIILNFHTTKKAANYTPDPIIHQNLHVRARAIND